VRVITGVQQHQCHQHLTSAHPIVLQDEDELQPSITRDVHALAICEGREGDMSLRLKFLISDESQVGKASKGVTRRAHSQRRLDSVYSVVFCDFHRR
jgi:hypothetical protein